MDEKQKSKDVDLYKIKLKEAFQAHPEKPNEKFSGYLLKGDVSGIQKFIFNVASKGAAKALKARSYYVQVIEKLSDQFALLRLKGSSSFYCGGGNFFLTIKEDAFSENAIKELQQEINKYLMYDEIAVTLSFIKISDYPGFGEAWNALCKESNKRKLQKFHSDYDLLFGVYSRQEETDDELERWPDTTILNDEEIFIKNKLFKAITDRLIKRSKIYTNLYCGLKWAKNESDFADKIVNKLPLWESYFKLTDYKEYRKKKYSEEEQELKNKNLIDFDGFGDFAAYRTGTNKIAVLKMDVDNLGKLFKDYIHSKEAGETISKAFGWFFDEYLYELWKGEFIHYRNSTEEKENYTSNIYPIFAGGDDCFIIGAWDAVLQFAKLFHDSFAEFVSLAQEELNKTTKKQITLSAGIIIVDPTHPVISISELAEHELGKSKAVDNKNSICLFGEVFSWAEYDKILFLSNKLTKEMKTQNIDRSYLNKIRQSAKGFGALQQEALNGKLEMQKIWRLKYYLGRKDAQSFKVVDAELFQPYYNALLQSITNRQETNPAIFPAAARITELNTRTSLSYVNEDIKKYYPISINQKPSYKKLTEEKQKANDEKKKEQQKEKDDYKRERETWKAQDFTNNCWKYYDGLDGQTAIRADYILNCFEEKPGHITPQTGEMVLHEWSVIKTSQLREIFKLVKKEIKIVRPLLIYTAARQNSKQAMGLVLFLKEIIEQIQTDEQLANFQAYFESIVAFHKYYHGHKSI